jgi:hypothetical protein
VRLKLQPLFRQHTITANGGFLIKSAVSKQQLYIGIIPVLKDGERGRHYDITLGCDDDTTFTGAVNTDLTLTLLLSAPPKEKEALTPALRKRIKEAYIDTASAYLACGFPPDTELDWISRKMLEELGLFTVPPTDLDRLSRTGF